MLIFGIAGNFDWRPSEKLPTHSPSEIQDRPMHKLSTPATGCHHVGIAFRASDFYRFWSRALWEHYPPTFDAAKLIPALEAILIEALEPREMRKRGDDLAAVEYLQLVDPEIEKRRVKATFDAALNKI